MTAGTITELYDLGHTVAHCEEFFDWYNNEHHHTSIGLLTPNDRHAGSGTRIAADRQAVLDHAYRASRTVPYEDVVTFMTDGRHRASRQRPRLKLSPTTPAITLAVLAVARVSSSVYPGAMRLGR